MSHHSWPRSPPRGYCDGWVSLGFPGPIGYQVLVLPTTKRWTPVGKEKREVVHPVIPHRAPLRRGVVKAWTEVASAWRGVGLWCFPLYRPLSPSLSLSRALSLSLCLSLVLPSFSVGCFHRRFLCPKRKQKNPWPCVGSLHEKNPGLVHFLRAHGFVVSCDNLKPRVDFIPRPGTVRRSQRPSGSSGWQPLLVGLWVVVLCGILFFALLLVILSEECQVKEEKCSEPSGESCFAEDLRFRRK